MKLKFLLFVLYCKKHTHAFVLRNSTESFAISDLRTLLTGLMSFPFFLHAIVKGNLLSAELGIVFLLTMFTAFVWRPMNIYPIQLLYKYCPPCGFLKEPTEKFSTLNPSYLENISALEYLVLRWTYVSHQQENEVFYRHLQKNIKPTPCQSERLIHMKAERF